MMKVRIYIGEEEVGDVMLVGDSLSVRANMPKRLPMMESMLESYTVELDGEPVTLDPEDDPVAFLFYLRRFYRSGQGVSAGTVEDETLEEGLDFDVENSFCPTGPGGGIKPDCGKGDAGSAPAATGGGARAKFDKVYEEYKAGQAMSKEGYSLTGQGRTPDEQMRGTVLKAKSFRKTSVAAHDATTEKNAENAVDEKGYRKARQEHRHAKDEYYRKSAEFVEMLEKDGVRPKEWWNTPKHHEWYEGTFESRQSTLSGLDRAKHEHYKAKAQEVGEAMRKSDSLEHSWKPPYYGEPEKVRDSGKSELDLVSDKVPPGVMRGSLNAAAGESVLQKFMAQAELNIQMKENSFEKLAASKTGEFKNGFEKGNVGSVGKGKKDYFNKRRDQEEMILGIKQEAEGKDRPVYGYMEHPDRAISKGYSVGDNYGAVQVKLKDSVKERTTYTVGDSLDDRGIWGGYAGAVNDPLAVSFGKTIQHRNMPLYTADQSPGLNTEAWNGKYHDGRQFPPSYIEAQYHGGLKLSDIAEVRVPKDVEIGAKALKGLEKAGVKVVRTPARHLTFYTLETPDADWNKKHERR